MNLSRNDWRKRHAFVSRRNCSSDLAALVARVAWRSGVTLCPINEVALHRAELVLGLVTACKQVSHLGM